MQLSGNNSKNVCEGILPKLTWYLFALISFNDSERVEHRRTRMGTDCQCNPLYVEPL